MFALRWRNRSREERFAIAAIATLVLALPYWVFMLYDCEFEQGFRLLMNNPSLAVFEVIFKPMAIGVFAARFPDEKFKDACKKIRGAAVSLLVLLVCISIGIAWMDSSQTWSERTLTPYDLNSTYRKDVLAKEITLRNQLHDTLKSVRSRKAQGDNNENKQGSADQKKETKNKVQEAKEQTKAEHVSFVDGKLANVERTLFTIGSCAAAWQRFFTFTSLLFIAITFWYLLVIAFARVDLPDKSYEGLLLSYSLMISWFPMRLYSEWYANFGILSLDSYTAFYLAGLFAVLFLWLLYVLNAKSVVLKSLVGGLSGLVAISGAIAKFDRDMFDEIAQLYSEAGVAGVGVLTIILLLILLASLSYYSKDTDVKIP